MIDTQDLKDLILAIVSYKSKYISSPTIYWLGKTLFLSKGAIEYRMGYLMRMGLLENNGFREPIRLKGEAYVPPPWIAIADEVINQALPEKNKRNEKRSI